MRDQMLQKITRKIMKEERDLAKLTEDPSAPAAVPKVPVPVSVPVPVPVPLPLPLPVPGPRVVPGILSYAATLSSAGGGSHSAGIPGMTPDVFGGAIISSSAPAPASATSVHGGPFVPGMNNNASYAANSTVPPITSTVASAAANVMGGSSMGAGGELGVWGVWGGRIQCNYRLYAYHHLLLCSLLLCLMAAYIPRTAGPTHLPV